MKKQQKLKRLLCGMLAVICLFTSMAPTISAFADEPESSSNSVLTELLPVDNELSSEGNTNDDVPNSDGAKPFVLLELTGQSKSTSQAVIGEPVSFRVGLNRDDVAVTYQWQRSNLPKHTVTEPYTLYDYAADADTFYSFPLEGVTEEAWLAQQPDASWQGMELYLAVHTALEDAGFGDECCSIAAGTRNYALEGYAFSAIADENGQYHILAEKDDTTMIGIKNADGKWAFENISAFQPQWHDLPDATASEYTYIVTSDNRNTMYRCVITVTDETYRNAALAELEKENIKPTDTEKELVLYSQTFTVDIDEETSEEALLSAPGLLAGKLRLFSESEVEGIHVSADAQWIEGLTENYEYITKDSYNRIHGNVTAEQESLYWTKLGSGEQKYYDANVLDTFGMPTGLTRRYLAFRLTDGKLEINSDWYGKTVYFRIQGSTGIGTAVDVPAYTGLNGAAGSLYKKAVTVLNPYVTDAGPVYLNFLSTLNRNFCYADDTHVRIYSVNCETFNSDPECYLLDAEGNYRMDSVAWGVNVGLEPNISGKVYWRLKDYLAEGYGLLVGHDTLYSYAGAYYDAFGTDFDESSIDPTDGSTTYYELNSWLPSNGHWRLNQLVGSNKGNVSSGTARAESAPSKILSTGGSNGVYGKTLMFGNDTLRVSTIGHTPQQALSTPKYRTPTNYPYQFIPGQMVAASLTHSNGQAAFGSIWVDYPRQNEAFTDIGCLDQPIQFTIGGYTGTNNFYLSGDGNFLMNQIGHLPTNSAHVQEVELLVNSILYVSQRKQCEICAAEQDDQSDVHFVHRINSANANEVLTALQNGGSYWYRLNDCYLLTEDLVLPEGWQPIANFSGHWDSDVYAVTLANNGQPLLANRIAQGTAGWNLGTDRSKGVQSVFAQNGTRTTGAARVVGTLNELFGTTQSYAGYTVKILGSDNPAYLQSSECYSCTVNTDSKYVISNLPCIYDHTAKSGVLRARVYDTTGREVTEYGIIRVNVDKTFWDTCMTTKLYLGSFTVEPVTALATMESAKVALEATATVDEPFAVVGWQYRAPGSAAWVTVPSNMASVSSSSLAQTADEDYTMVSQLVFADANPKWDGYQYRCVFQSTHHGSWNTYEYWTDGSTASNTDSGGRLHRVYSSGKDGKLTVGTWPARLAQSADKTVYEGESVTFSATALVLDGDGLVSAEWEYSTTEFDEITGEYLAWHPLSENADFAAFSTASIEVTETMPAALQNSFAALSGSDDFATFQAHARFYRVNCTLTVTGVDIAADGTRFRVHYSAVSKHGTAQELYSNAADDTTGKWVGGAQEFYAKGFASGSKSENHSNKLTVLTPELHIITTKSADFAKGAVNQDLGTPDEYGQTLLLSDAAAQTCSGTAVYQATVYYKPGSRAPTPAWEYKTYTDSTAHAWNTAAAQALGYGSVAVTVQNSTPTTASYNGEDGWMSMVSTMTISNVPPQMYNVETLLKYYFRCTADASYTTSRGEKRMVAADKWGGLTIDYQIDLHTNGVLEYDGGQNIVNDTTVTSYAQLYDATADRNASTWRYSKLSITIPDGHFVNTVVVYLDPDSGYDSRDYLSVDSDALAAVGITTTEAATNRVILTAAVKNTVDRATWENALRTHLRITTYDEADFLDRQKIANGTTGGALVRWTIDENSYTGTKLDPDTGHLYKIITADEPLSWEAAKAAAENYNSDLALNGYLAEVNSAAENELVRNLLGSGNEAWIGGTNLDSGTWHWAGSNAALAYTNWADGEPDTGYAGNHYMAISGTNGKWAAKANSTEAETTLTYRHVGLVSSGGGWDTRDVIRPGDPNKWYRVHLIQGHIYYLSLSGGGFGDSNTSCGISFSAFGISRPAPAWNVRNTYSGVLTFTGATGDYDIVYWAGNTGPDYSGHYTVVFENSVVDLTVSNGAGNEPGLEWCESNIGPLAPGGSKNVTTHARVVNTIARYVVEYEPQAMAVAYTNHSATDVSTVGTKPQNNIVPPEESKVLTVKISGKRKVYDGTAIAPSAFAVESTAAGAGVGLVQITYTCTKGTDHAGYTNTTVGGNNWRRTNAVHAATYHAVVSLTDAAIAAGWTLSADSHLECDLVITRRPLDVVSCDNDKVYDGTAAATISGIVIAPAAGSSGVVGGDTVRLNRTDDVAGTYYKEDGTETIHNSATNHDGKPYQIVRSESAPLYIIHDAASDPHHDYYLRSESYTGSIAARPLVVHSRYLEQPLVARNIKQYDGNDTAVIAKIMVDNIVAGDEVTLNKKQYRGAYATPDAGEMLTETGKAQPNRLLRLTETAITRNADDPIELVNNPYGDYYIAEEVYSGAIYRAMLTAQISSWRGIYGEGLTEAPWADTEYKTGESSESWLRLEGLKGDDTLTINKTKSRFVFDLLPDATTHVGSYPLSYAGLNEGNYPILANYIVAVMDGRLEVIPRQIRVTAEGTERVTRSRWKPLHSSFALEQPDGTFSVLGSDSSIAYGSMPLVDEDTIASVLVVQSEDGTQEALQMSAYLQQSNIPYQTDCTADSPARYLNGAKTEKEACAFCEDYFGFADGTAHAPLAGYSLQVNLAPENGGCLAVATVENIYGEWVKDYELVSESGRIIVHPYADVQMEVTVPLAVCMYAYGPTGAVVTPDNYGITNLSSCDVQIANIKADGAWELTPKPIAAGQLALRLQDTQLANGSNNTAWQEPWIIARADRKAGTSVFLPIAVTANIAPNVNDAGEHFTTHVEYTVEVYQQNP